MERETYNSRLRTNPEDIPVGSLLQIKKHCRKNNIIEEHGEFAVLVERPHGTYISHDVLFPSGRRTIFVPMNWDVVSHANKR
tara:strand:+ start:543 stop:788 length:246 start_codon:yes stop_codon:yes gene_type:complete